MVASLFWLLVFLLVYGFFPKGRKAMIWTAILYAPAGAISEHWFLQDYWTPSYLLSWRIADWGFGLEDFLSTAALAGLAAAMFEARALRADEPSPRMAVLNAFIMEGWGFLGLVLMVLLTLTIHLSSMDALLIAVTSTSLLMLYRRPRFLGWAMPLALAGGGLYWIFYKVFLLTLYPGIFQAQWNLEITWGIRIGGVPVEECLWISALVLFCGPAFRVASEIADKRAARSSS